MSWTPPSGAPLGVFLIGRGGRSRARSIERENARRCGYAGERRSQGEHALVLDLQRGLRTARRFVRNDGINFRGAPGISTGFHDF
jgi:hypothetical protein